MSVAINPGDSWQAKNDANGDNTTFDVAAGTHANATVANIKPGNKFIGPPPTNLKYGGPLGQTPVSGVWGAIMDGVNVTQYAFNGLSKPGGVEIRNIEVKRYNPPQQFAMISPSGNFPADASTGWILDYIYAHHSLNAGLRICHGIQLLRSISTDNFSFGVSGPGDNWLMQSCLLERNGDPAHAVEGGATKFVRGNGGRVLNNFVRATVHGPGIWFDIANDRSLVEGNWFEDGYQHAVALEISYGAIVRRNLIRRTGVDSALARGGISISASGGGSLGYNPGVDVYENFIEGCGRGTVLFQQARGTNWGDPAGVDPEMWTINAKVHDNIVVLKGTKAANDGVAWGDQDTDSLLFTRNNRFYRNRYVIRTTDPTPHKWNNAQRSFAYWQATAGQDTDGFQYTQLAHYRPGEP